MSQTWNASILMLVLAVVCNAQASPVKRQSTAEMPGASGRIPAERVVLTDENLFETFFILVANWAEPRGLMKQEAQKDLKKYNDYVRGKIKQKTLVSDKEADFLKEMSSSCNVKMTVAGRQLGDQIKQMPDLARQGPEIAKEGEKKLKQLAADRDFVLKDCIRRTRWSLGDQKFERLKFVLDSSIGPMLRPRVGPATSMITVGPEKGKR